MSKYRIVWNQAKTIGVIVTDDRDGEKAWSQLAYELRKGACNTLGLVPSEFMDAWGDFTASDNCTIQDVSIDLTGGEE